ncbi:helix-turn-helix transcriptional regulator [Nocardiopsis potens]|uniref:helix-turn-helix transcriptional regulator n=1 Tax=Nocardiopsis potens TaxID=1246458 RepID=UPI00034C958F|nr:YafY family protein [Nocardiopsis potens]
MLSTSARLLLLLSLLADRPSWTCEELAERLEVTGRTVRRDIARLRELGYGVESDPGPWGGYGLGSGDRIPPLALDDEEALAIAVALREAALGGDLGGDQAALSALLKLGRLLPAAVARRLGEMDAALAYAPGSEEGRLAAGMLLELASACRGGERCRLSYRDRSGRATVREVDPYRLVRAAGRWYFVARDVARGEWRTFRADRVRRIEPCGRPADPVEGPDPVRLVAESRAAGRYPVHAVVRLPVPMERALLLVPPSVGAHRPDGPDATVVEIGGPDADGLAGYLLGLDTPLRVLAPDAVRTAFLERVRSLLAENGEQGPP